MRLRFFGLFRVFRLFLLTLFLPGSQLVCFGQDEITVETISGQTLAGRLNRIDPDGSLIGEGFEGTRLDQVLSITTKRTLAPPPSGRVKLRLVDGGLVFVADPTLDGETIEFAPTASGLESISLQSVRAVVFRESNLIREAVAQPATDQDTVIVTRGTSIARVSGVLESVDAEKLMLNFKGKSRPIKLEKVAAIVIADLGMKTPAGAMANVSLADGSSIRGVLTGFDDELVSLELTGKQTLSIGRQHLVRIDIASDSIAWLSTLEPVEVRQQPQFTILRPWQRNLSIERNPLRLLTGVEGSSEATEVQTFKNGIGTSSYSRLVFENEKNFSRFLATVGIDAETEGRGDCEMRVEGDGITLWSRRMRGKDAAVDIEVDISGINRVALIVDPGEQFDLADHADWARARFIRTE